MLSLSTRYEAALDPWMLSLWRSLNDITPMFFPKGIDFAFSSDTLIDQPSIHVIYHDVGKLDTQLTSGTLVS